MRLYNSSVSGNCYKVRLLLAHLGLDCETIEVDVVDRSNRPTELVAVSASARVPVLILDDGRGLAESSAILCYLAEGSAYLPEDRYARAQVLQWLFFEQYDHEPNLAVARFWHALVPNPEAYADRIEAKREGGHRALAAMERHLEGATWFVDGRYTIADIALFAYTHVAPEGGVALEPYPQVRAWIERVRAQPGHVPMVGGS